MAVFSAAGAQAAMVYPSTIPQWVIDFHFFRQSLFLSVIEPVIVFLLGPAVEDSATPAAGGSMYSTSSSAAGLNEEHARRRLSFLPAYVEDASVYKETSMSFASFCMLFLILGCLMLVFLSCFYHNQKTSPLFISPRRHRLPKLVPPPLPVDSFFSWLKVIFFMADEEIINRIGYDALIFLRFHRLALRCIVKMSFFSFLVLLPINFMGGGHVNANEYKEYVGKLIFTDFLRFTMANVREGSPRLWVHCFAAYLLTAIVAKELLVEYRAFSHIRHRYLLSRETHLRTVLVTNIPRHLRTAKKISTYFKHVYPEAVKSVTICQNVIQLERLVAQRTAVLTKIERELLLLCRQEKKKLVGLTVVEKALMAISSPPGCCADCSFCDGPQERLAKLYAELEILNDSVEKEQKRRRRVMKRIDKMEAEEGNSDIDYILASPFISENAENLKRMGLGGFSAANAAGGEGRMETIDERRHREGAGIGAVGAAASAAARPSFVGAPRHPDGSLMAPKPYEPPTLGDGGGTVPQKGGGSQDAEACAAPEGKDVYTDDGDVSWGREKDRNGPFVRKAASSSSIAYQSAISQQGDRSYAAANAHLSEEDMFGATSATGDPLGPDDADDDKENKLLKRNQSFIKARRAIRQYSHFDFFSKKLKHRKAPMANGMLEPGQRDPVDHIENHNNEVCDKAFVVMRTFTASTIAMQSMHSSKPGSMQVATAPEPRDILWENAYMSKGAKRTRSFIGDVFVLLLITFYVFPVALVSLLVSDSALISYSPRLAQLDRASAFFSTAIGMVQPVCLVCIQQLMPPFLMQIGKAEGHLAFSEVQMKTFSRYFSFQVLNIFLVTAIAGSVFDTLATVLETPEAGFYLLGNSLPRMSSFFVTYVTMKTFIGLGVELVRTISLVQGSLRFILFPNSTLRQQRAVRLGCRAIDDPGWFPFHKILAQDMLVVVISVVFAVVAPLVLIPCAMFYLFSRILWTHHHLFVFESVFETGGQFWPKIFRRFVFGLIISQATITGQFLAKQANQEAIATIILMFLTYAFLRSTRARYDATSSALPLEVATIMDISISQEEDAMRKRNQPNQQSGPHEGPQGGSDNTSHYSSEVAEEHYDKMLGNSIGQYDPFEHAYIQPVLRASSRARPEQPFPPSQLGREEVFTGHRFAARGLRGMSPFLGEEEKLGQRATVKLKSLNKQDRALVDRWWSDQFQRAGKQKLFSVLIGQESGTLLIGKRANLVHEIC